MKMLLINLDPQRIPPSEAVSVLTKFYSKDQYSARNLRKVSHGLIFIIQHIETICQFALFLNKKKD